MPETGYIVHATWDDEAKVFVATSESIHGLVTEAPDWQTLLRYLREIIPELLLENGQLSNQSMKEAPTSGIPFEVIAHYSERVRPRS
jgi:Domain of unknown function (DUF1902)